jgi:hypothetical protein
MKDEGPQRLGDLFGKVETKKPPAHEWQDLALRIIDELSIPGFKRGSVFKICKDKPKETVEKSFNDTKELCTSGAKWKYFFKVIADKKE